MTKSIFKIRTADNLQLHGVDWCISNPKAVICLVHGFGEHINRYEEVSHFFNKNHIALVGMDRRGFGISEGVRGHVSSYEVMLDEVDLLLEKAERSYPNVPKILYGHSQGGNIVLNYIIRRKPNVLAAVVTSPWIKLKKEASKLMVMLAKAISRVYPKFRSPTNMDVKFLSRDKTVVKKYIDDPLVHSYITAKNAVEMVESAIFLRNYKGMLNVPVLLVHGEADEITCMKATESFFNQVQGDVALKVWKGLFHETHNEPEKEKVLSYTLNWLDEYI